MENLKETCLLGYHQGKGAKLEAFAGYLMPIVYTSIIEEHNSVRNNVGMFDVSHMGEILVKGKDTCSYVDHVFSNEITSKPDGKVVYGMLLYERGTIVDDLLVYKISDQECLLVVNASNTGKDYTWLVEQSDGFDVTVANLSDDYGQIAIQGPNAEATIKDLFDIDLSELGFYTFAFKNILDCKVIVSRTGYTGEDGFEIYGDPMAIRLIWDAFDAVGVTPCGLGARDTLRFEAALPLYGHEISDEITPVEAGLKMFVRFEKNDFIGKQALEEQIESGLKRRLVGLELLQTAIPREGYPVYSGDNEIGYVTTGYLSITLKKPIAMAMVDVDHAKIGTEIAVKIRNKLVPGVVRDRKFLQKNYKK